MPGGSILCVVFSSLEELSVMFHAGYLFSHHSALSAQNSISSPNPSVFFHCSSDLSGFILLSFFYLQTVNLNVH